MKAWIGVFAALGLMALAPAARAQAQDMTFRWASSGGDCPDCRWIAADGEIVMNTPAAFRKFLQRNDVPAGTTLRLESPGGSLEQSIALGRMIREAGLNTNVGKTIFLRGRTSEEATHGKGACASACAYTFLGGVERRVETGSRLGVHQFYSGDNLEGSDASAQWAIAQLGFYLAEIGADNEIILIAAATPSESMRWLDRDTLERIGAVTERRAPGEADWEFALAEATFVLKTSQQQPNGSFTEFVLACSSAEPASFQVLARHRGQTPPADRVEALRNSLKTLRLRANGMAETLAVDRVLVTDEGLEIAFKAPREGLRRLAGLSGQEIYLDLDAPAALSGLLGGATHRLPVSNLDETASVLERNCTPG